MASIVLYFHAHQPYRIKNYQLFSIGQDSNYFDTDNDRLNNQKILLKVAQNCYLPTNKLLLKLIQQYPNFKISFSLSGLLLEQLSEYAPEVLKSFADLVQTGNVEILAETYYHSLAFIYSETEFISQVQLHKQKIFDLFDYQPTAFRNTELIYNNEVAKVAEKLGFKTILAEGVDRHLEWRSPNYVYRPKDTTTIKLLLKNYRFSDDIAFRFSDRTWKEWPLSCDKYVHWLAESDPQHQLINLFMDYETFGEHHWAQTGIFEFLAEFPQQINQYSQLEFLTVSEASEKYQPVGELDIRELTSWSDVERDVSAWLQNPMQLAAAKAIFALESEILTTADSKLIHDWRRLTASDHFYYMSTKHMSDQQVHDYFSPNKTPFEAYTNYMNILHDLRQRVYTRNTKE